MKNLSLVFGRAFVFYFLLFTLPQLIIHLLFPIYINGRVFPSLERQLITGLIIGMITATLATLSQMWYVRRWARKNNFSPQSLDYSAHQKLEMEVDAPLLSVFQDLKDRLPQHRWEITKQDEQKGFLQFKVVRKWQVPDELVTIRLEPTGTQQTRVKIDSKTDSLLNFADNAHNLKNVYQVRQALAQ